MQKHHFKKSKKQNKNKKVIGPLNQSPDGTTYTLEMAIPSSSLHRPLSNTFVVVQSYATPSYFLTSISNPTFTVVTPTLANLDQAASWVAVFDQYRILECEVWLTPAISASVSSSHGGQLYSVLDFDDANALTTLGQALDYETCVTTPQTNGHYRKFRPHAAQALYAPSAFAQFGNVISPWINSAYTGCAHYGVKYAASITSAVPSIFDLTVRLKIEFRSPR